MAKRMTRFAVAVHILAILEIHKKKRNTSDDLAAGIGTNSAFIRRVTSMLGKANLIKGEPGVGGNRLLKSVEQITLFEVFQAVQSPKENKGFGEFSCLSMYELPGDEKPESVLIHGVLKDIFVSVEQAIEDELSLATIADVVTEARRRMSSPNYKSKLAEIFQFDQIGNS